LKLAAWRDRFTNGHWSGCIRYLLGEIFFSAIIRSEILAAFSLTADGRQVTILWRFL